MEPIYLIPVARNFLSPIKTFRARIYAMLRVSYFARKSLFPCLPVWCSAFWCEKVGMSSPIFTMTPQETIFWWEGQELLHGLHCRIQHKLVLKPHFGQGKWLGLSQLPLAIPFTPVLHLNCSPSATDCSTPFLSGKVVNVLSVMVANWY